MMHAHVMAAAVSWVLKGAREVFPTAFGAFAQVSAPAAVAALWQGAAVALALVLCLRLAPRVSAVHRFAAWAAGFAVVVCLPFLPLIAHGAAETEIAVSAPLRVAAAKPWLQLDSRWGFAIAALWLAASALRAASLGLHSLRLRKLWKTATPIQAADSLAAMASGRRPIEICTTQELDRPSVIGFLAPRILIPDWLFERLTPGELEQVVLHEAEHLRRHDDWINLLQKLALVFFPLNPALAWIEGRLCREREMACDEGVVRRTQAPSAYAACLTSLAERGLERRAEALSLGAWQRRPDLVRRVHSILWRKQALHPFAARALVGVVCCGLLLASVELARCPQMVAFVAAPTPQSVAIAQLQPGSARTAYAPQAASGFRAGFRAIPAKAILPSNVLAPIGDAPAYHAARRPQPAAEPRQQLVKATMASLPSACAEFADQKSEPRLIVFTTWEEVRTSTLQPAEIADYDTGAAAQQQTGDAASQPGAKRATQITVTRLILVVYPVSFAPAPASGSQKPSSSKPVRPAPPPAASGWLVFQL